MVVDTEGRVVVRLLEDRAAVARKVAVEEVEIGAEAGVVAGAGAVEAAVADRGPVSVEAACKAPVERQPQPACWPEYCCHMTYTPCRIPGQGRCGGRSITVDFPVHLHTMTRQFHLKMYRIDR